MTNHNCVRSGYMQTRTSPQPSCACGRQKADAQCDSDPVMAYVPRQSWGDIYSECQALRRGTLFAGLDKPFFGKGGGCCV